MAAVTICIRKMQIKTTEIPLHTYKDGKKQTSKPRTTENPKTKQRKISSGQDVGKMEPSYFAGGNREYGTQLGIQLGRPSESSQKYLVTQQSHS